MDMAPEKWELWNIEIPAQELAPEEVDDPVIRYFPQIESRAYQADTRCYNEQDSHLRFDAAHLFSKDRQRRSYRMLKEVCTYVQTSCSFICAVCSVQAVAELLLTTSKERALRIFRLGNATP